MKVKYVGSFCTEERYMLIGFEAKNDDKVLKREKERNIYLRI